MAIVSVIIPLFNRKKLIAETLSSVAAALHPGIEIETIVVDDGSTDGGADWVESNFPAVRLFRQSNQGAPTARNLGLKSAKGDYILFLDSDDIVSPDFFRKKVEALEKNQLLSAVYGPWEHFKKNEAGEKMILPRHTAYPIETEPDYKKHLTRLLSGWYIIPHAILWRKDVLINTLGGFDENLKINQDVDLLFRLLVEKKFITGVESSLALYRDHDEADRTGSIGKSPQKLNTILELRKSFIKKLTDNGLFTTPNKNALSKFCFNYWKNYRLSHTETAAAFYNLSVSLNPNLELEGGTAIKLMSKLLGAKRAFVIKSWFMSGLLKK